MAFQFSKYMVTLPLQITLQVQNTSLWNLFKDKT